MTSQQRYEYWYKKLQVNGQLLFAGRLLQRAAQQWPNKTAIICNDITLTYQEVYDRSRIVTFALLENNIKSQDRVILLCENSPIYHSLYYGIWQTGAVVVPVNTFLHEQELEHIIKDCKPSCIIVSEKFKDKIPAIGSVSYKLFSETDFDFTLLSPDLEIPDQDPDLSGEAQRAKPDALAAILYTSGTTGLPKGVMLSSRNILTNAAQAGALFDTTESERIFAALPLFHSYMQNSCLWSGIIAGVTIILVPKIDRKALLFGLAQKPTVILGIPGLYGLFCLFKTIDFSHVRYFISGGDALPDKIRMLFALLYRRKICNGYGLTECSPFIAIDVDDAEGPTNVVGKPALGVQISLRDEHNNEVPSEAIGTLWVKGDNIMLGYYNAQAATQSILIDGWLNTGDLARIDHKTNKLIICGRSKDLIVNNGIKIYPQEIENVLMSDPRVMNAAVVGMPENGDEIPVAFVVIKKATPTNVDQELKQLCAQNLAPYKVPRRFYIEDELPLTTTGKVDKKVLRARLKQ